MRLLVKEISWMKNLQDILYSSLWNKTSLNKNKKLLKHKGHSLNKDPFIFQNIFSRNVNSALFGIDL